MSRRSVVALVTLFAAIAGVVVHSAQQIPETVRARSRQSGRVRVIVQLALPSPYVPEGNLTAAGTILNQRRAIADGGRGCLRGCRKGRTAHSIDLERPLPGARGHTGCA